MGLLEDIGETIGNALGALAEFIGDAGDFVVRGVFAGASSLGNDILKLILGELTGSETEIKLTASAILTDVDKRVFTDTKDIIDGALAVLGEVTPDEAEAVLDGLWDTNKIALQQAMLNGMIAEAVSLGQFDGMYQYLDIYNRALGLEAVSSTISMMKYKTAWLTSYQRKLNSTYPNKIAGSSDLVRFALREVWDKDRRPELLKEDAPQRYYDYMLESGFTRDRASDYWASHWVLPSVGQLNEMLHRRKISPETWDRFVKYNDFDPKVRPLLKAISYKPYTRVDTRRMWDLAELSEQEVYDNYQDLGYDEEHAKKMTTWTKLYVIAVELRARYSKGWISAEDVKTEVIAAGMKPERAETWVQKIIKPDQETRTEKERDVTKSEIIKGVKTGVITRSDAIELLLGMGYDEDEANYILEINIPIDEEDEVVKERQLTKADILKALIEEVITREEAKDKLMEIRYPSAAAEMLLEIFDAQVETPATARLKEASKADIVLGVKKGLITQEEAYGMLLDLGFGPDAAMFILAVKTEESPFSPINYEEFWKLVNLRKKSLGLPVKKVPEELKELEKPIRELEDLRREGVRTGEGKKFFTELDKTLDPLKERYLTLRETGTGSGGTLEAPTGK